MDLKNAAAVCLISLFSATLVVLIARALDLQAASRIEPQLERMVEELQALRSQGGITATSGTATDSRTVDDGLMVYYFHGIRCVTCRAAEANAHETLVTQYAPQLENGEVVWKVLDYMQDPQGKAMAINFQVADPTIVLVRMKGGQMETWNRLDRVLALAQDKPALSAYLQEEIDEMLKTPDGGSEPDEPTDAPAIPVPGDDTDQSSIATDPTEIPIPE